MTTTNEKNLRILNHKITNCERLIDRYIEMGISERKIDKQERILNKAITDRNRILSED